MLLGMTSLRPAAIVNRRVVRLNASPSPYSILQCERVPRAHGEEQTCPELGATVEGEA
jgi:hypothetical protein